LGQNHFFRKNDESFLKRKGICGKTVGLWDKNTFKKFVNTTKVSLKGKNLWENSWSLGQKHFRKIRKYDESFLKRKEFVGKQLVFGTKIFS